MKKFKLLMFATMLLSTLFLSGEGTTQPATQIVDTYKIKMSIYVPRIYDNYQSLGYRKYQKQSLTGELQIIYNGSAVPKIQVQNLVNNTQRGISYVCYNDDGEDWTYGMVVGLGSNRTRKWTQSGMKFQFWADPSYNIGSLGEDNSLFLDLAGKGSFSKKFGKQIPNSITGSVSGQIGCGCREYGHTSPTRAYKGEVTDIVTDIAPVYGTWNARFKSRIVK